MLFRQFQPTQALAPYVRTYWLLEHDLAPEGPEPVIPDGCMELIFHYGDRYISNIADREELQNGAVIVGQIKTAISLQPTGNTGIFAVRFQPWGFYAFTGMPLHRLTETVVDARDIWGNDTRYVYEQLATAAHNEKAAVVDKFLLKALRKQRDGTLHKVSVLSAILAQLHRHKGNIPVAHMAYNSNSSVRNFNRNVTEMTGLSPKVLARIIRLQSFLNIHTEDATLTDTLYRCGYYDQAHFIREFREIAGTTPNSFFKEENTMAELMWQ